MKEHIIESLNAEIACLTAARNLLLGMSFKESRRGNAQRGPMSEATKRKIGQAMAKRWAERRAKKK